MIGIGRGFSRFPKFGELSSSAIWPLRISSRMPPRASSLGGFHWWILWHLLSGEQKGLWDTLQLIYLTKLQNLDFILGFTMFFQRYHKPAYIIVPKYPQVWSYIILHHVWVFQISRYPQEIRHFSIFFRFFFMVNPHPLSGPVGPPRPPHLELSHTTAHKLALADVHWGGKSPYRARFVCGHATSAPSRSVQSQLWYLYLRSRSFKVSMRNDMGWKWTLW